MRRWQRVGIAGALALAALLMRPRRAGDEEVEQMPGASPLHPDHERSARESGASSERVEQAE